MKKFFIFVFSAFFINVVVSQTIIGTEDFEAASPNWILNSTDLGSTSGGDNGFIITNDYAGGTYMFIPIPDTPDQPVGIIGSPRSKYLHVNCTAAGTQGIKNANYLVFFTTKKRFAKMNYDWNTTSKTGVYLEFWWLGVGSKGSLYYSTNGGATWTLVLDNLNNQSSWALKTVTNSAFDNKATLRFAFMFDEAGTAQDPPLCVDQMVLKHTIALAPVADFSTTSTSICAGSCISFSDISTNSPNSWSWSFPGATVTTSSAQNPNNICYNTPGNYPVSLTATNASGSNTKTLSSYITVTAVSTPTFSLPTTYCKGATPSSLPTTSGNGINGTWFPATISTSSTGSSTYTFTPSAGQCALNASLSIGVYDYPIGSINGPSFVCSGENVFLEASGGGTYLWSNGSTYSQITINLNSSSNYSLIVSNFGCNDTVLFNVNVYPELNVNAGTDLSVSHGGSLILNAVTSSNDSIVYNWLPQLYLSCTDCANPICTPEQSIEYTVTITDENGCKATDNIYISIDENCGDIFAPNVFSPNGDTKNDLFLLKGSCIEKLEIRVFNRWGNMIFESFDKDFQWDGVYKGEKVPQGVYFYTFKVTFEDGTTKNGKSSLTIVR